MDLRATVDLLKRINLICPVQSHLQKYFCFCLTQITSISPAIPSHRGAFRDRHGRRARDAVDAAAFCARRDRRAGRKVRERLQSAVTRDVAAAREGGWSFWLDAGVKVAEACRPDRAQRCLIR